MVYVRFCLCPGLWSQQPLAPQLPTQLPPQENGKGPIGYCYQAKRAGYMYTPRRTLYYVVMTSSGQQQSRMSHAH